MNLFGTKQSSNILFETNYLGFWIKVYPHRVDFKSGVGSQSIPVNQVASVQLGMIGVMSIIIETTGGKKYKIPCHKKKEVKEAIYKAQEAYTNQVPNIGSNTSIADELAKLTQLKNQGILNEQEFDTQKEKLLS